MSLSIWFGSFVALSLAQMQGWFHVGDDLKWLLCFLFLTIIVHHTKREATVDVLHG